MDRNFKAFEKAEKSRHDTLVAKLDSMIANTKASTASLGANNAAWEEELEDYERRLRVLELNARDEDRTV
jgi:hypothetical protein